MVAGGHWKETPDSGELLDVASKEPGPLSAFEGGGGLMAAIAIALRNKQEANHEDHVHRSSLDARRPSMRVKERRPSMGESVIGAPDPRGKERRRSIGGPDKPVEDVIAEIQLAAPTHGFWKCQPQAAALYLNIYVQLAVAVLIVLNFLTNIAEKQFWPSGSEDSEGGIYFRLFGVLEYGFNAFFTVELVLNMYAFWFKQFWASGWNVFDFLVVSVSFVTMAGGGSDSLKMLRMVRAFRVFRLFKRVESLRKILVALINAVPGMLNAFFLMLLVMCIYAILAVEFFRDEGHGGTMVFESGDEQPYTTLRGNDFGREYFGNFGKALFTLLQVLTGDSWSEAVGRPLLQSWSSAGAGFFFSTFILIHSIILINVVIAVLLEKMVTTDDASDDDSDEEEYNARIENELVADEATVADDEPARKTSPRGAGQRPQRRGSNVKGPPRRTFGFDNQFLSPHAVVAVEAKVDKLGGELHELRETVNNIDKGQKMILEALNRLAHGQQSLGDTGDTNGSCLGNVAI